MTARQIIKIGLKSETSRILPSPSPSLLVVLLPPCLSKFFSWLPCDLFGAKNVDPEEYLHFEVKNQNITDSKTIGMGKVPLK